MDCQILKLVLTRDKPGLTKKQLVFRCFQVRQNTTGCIAACFLSNPLHCKNRECETSKQMPSTTTGVTWHNTEQLRSRNNYAGFRAQQAPARPKRLYYTRIEI